jgi:hypothetical protein
MYYRGLIMVGDIYMSDKSSADLESSLNKKAEDLDNNVKALNFRLNRTIKTIKTCRGTCKSTLDLIEEMKNGWAEKH